MAKDYCIGCGKPLGSTGPACFSCQSEGTLFPRSETARAAEAEADADDD